MSFYYSYKSTWTGNFIKLYHPEESLLSSRTNKLNKWTSGMCETDARKSGNPHHRPVDRRPPTPLRGGLPCARAWFLQDAARDDPSDCLLAMNQTSAVDPTPRNSFQEMGTMRRVDFVLTYHYHSDGDEQEKAKRRKNFEDCLEAEGLELERQPSIASNNIYFLKIKVPYEVMCIYAEILEMRKPLKSDKELGHAVVEEAGTPKRTASPKARGLYRSSRPSSTRSRLCKTEFRINLKDLFNIPDEGVESFFTSSERAQVIWYILRRSTFGEDGKVGIYSLLANGTYHDAYPLHDGDYASEGDEAGSKNMRYYLKNVWARPGVWLKEQPLDEIREYFGDEVALYFAWLGLYTRTLIPAAIMGVICFLYGLTQLATPDKEPVEEVCDGQMGEVLICSRCNDESCPEEKLRSSCGTRILLLLVDHPATVAFSIFMSFWATGFLEHWKRTQARLSLRWGGEAILSTGGSDRDTWETRPEYEASAREKPDSVTNQKRTYHPMWLKVLRIFTAASVVFFMVAIVVAALIGVIVYKVAISSALYFTDDDYVKTNSKNLTALTAAIINLIIIILLKMVYDKIAIWLTNMENPKTQSDYENSYTFKVFVFEFFNCYSSLFYIAFFKGRFYTYPGDSDMSNSFLAQDACDSGGCLAELFIQLVVIMVGKQLLNCFTEILLPRFGNWRSDRKFRSQVSIGSEPLPRWEADHKLQRADNLSLFQEMMEIVLQYGFVTLFVVAFPLAPLCALLNNAAEIRVDADKLVTQYRRPLPRRTNSIGPWFTIQQTIAYLAVAVNGFIIAFTSEFIPRLVYLTTVSKDHSLAGYVNFTLSVYARNTTADTHNIGLLDHQTCRYKGFREPPGSEHPYALSSMHWHVLTAQLGFVIVFEHLVLGLSGLLAYCIPDIPRSVREQAHKERETKARDIRQLLRPKSP